MSTLSRPSSAHVAPVRSISAVGSAGGSMTALRPASPAAGAKAPPYRGATLVLLAGLAAVCGLGLALTASGAFAWSLLPAAIVVYAAIAATAFAGLRHHPHARFGAPNIVTTVRAVATAVFAGLLLDAAQSEEASDEAAMWLFAAIAFFALVLDGVDGYLARRLGLSSAYGARYDMEVDALLILLLSVLAFVLGKAGAFVLAIGLMRYAFVAAQQALPWLRGELPPSFRRKLVCVMQAAVLGVIVTPLVAPPFSNAAAMVTVGFLAWSFAVDSLWLWRHRRSAA